MRLSLSYKSTLKFVTKKEVSLVLVALIAIGLPLLWVRQVYSPKHKTPKTAASKLQTLKPITPSPSLVKPQPKTSTPVVVAFSHLSVISTIFWVGESASRDNGGISNKASAWDGHWSDHFGGVDDPKRRNGYFPADFGPKENPFYVALPYSDITDSGNRKATATSCPMAARLKGQPYSWCKNSWLALRHNGKVVYAQWEDVGPFEKDDFNYVFGSSPPLNRDGESAGIDTSPAVAIYLGLGDVDRLDWGFVDASSVPSGPWSQVVTTDLGDSL
jgi:hypothetical protein